MAIVIQRSNRLIVLDEAIIARLGKVSDEKLAIETGFGKSTIALKRNELGIKPYRSVSKPIELTDEVKLALGTDSDSKIAARFGVKTQVIYHARKLLNIPPFKSLNSKVEWTPKMDELLGYDTDTKIAKLLGVSKHATSYRRTTLNIPSHNPSRALIPDKKIILLLGTDTDLNIAKRLQISFNYIRLWRKQRGIPPFTTQTPCPDSIIPRLGTKYDKTLAREYGCSSSTVSKKRRILKIEAFDPFD